jgi:tRNA modification GTPase
MPLRLVDTAGLRATDDVVERLGIEVSEKYLAQAQAVLACAEDVAGLITTIERVRPLTRAPLMPVLTKADSRSNLLGDVALASVAVSAALGADTGIVPRDGISENLRATIPTSAFQPVIAVSAENGTGLGALIASIVARLNAQNAEGFGLPTSNESDTPITRERHRIALSDALEEISEFERAWREDEVPATIAAVHLRSAVHVLDELIGSVSVDDVLDRLFREFCVGK